MMRRVFALILAIGLLTSASAETQLQIDPSHPELGLKLIKEYRAKPDAKSVPGLIRALSERNAFKDPETSGVYVGFLAGVLGANPKSAKSLIAEILPLPFEDQWLLIRAVAYSGLPNWRDLMWDLSNKLPDRQLLTEYYLTGKLPTLEDVPLEPAQPTAMDKFKRIFERETYTGDRKKERQPLTFATSPELIDTQWGFYFATGKDASIGRLVTLLPWTNERDSVDKLTIGSMAKFTLAANAAYDVKLLGILKRLSPQQSKKIQPILGEVIEAAETADTGRIRKEALAAVDELRKKGPGSRRDIAWWGELGQTAISMGCLGAAVAGQAEFGIPCIVGGAVSTATLRYFASPQ
jgi:hypothetical protein